MATARISADSFIILLLVLAILSTSLAGYGPQLKETNMSLYLHDYSAGPKANDFPITGKVGKEWTALQFGTVIVADDPITESPDASSAPVGRAQGMYVISGLGARPNAFLSLSIVFTNKIYNGSSLELQGISKELDPVREVSVISGTESFRYARGYATIQDIYIDIPNSYRIIRCNVSVLHQ